jgi:tRNA-Thr(GGU) m(6)t(6)A37 methyltransferase TsaA
MNEHDTGPGAALACLENMQAHAGADVNPARANAGGQRGSAVVSTMISGARILRLMSSLPDPDFSRLVLEPIGIVRTSLATKVEAARQPRAAQGTQARIELFPGRNFEHALEDLSRWKLIWVVFWFHHNPDWRPKVLPPRSTSGRKGVFATRSPHRPNPIGLSVVRLEKVDGLNIHVLDADMLDGTPVLDLKPYVAYTDSHPDAGNGWLDDAETSQGSTQPVDPVAAYTVTFLPLATEQTTWIETRTGLAIAERIRSTLMLGPEPHPYRRIRRLDDGMRR